MAKGDDDRARRAQEQRDQQQRDEARQSQETRHADLRSQFSDQYSSARTSDEALRSNLENAFLGLGSEAEGLLGRTVGAGGGGGGGGGFSSGGAGGAAINIPGGIDPSKITNFASEPYSVYQGLGRGIDDAFMEDWRTQSAGLGTAGKTLDEAETAYRNFISTGGYQPGELDAMRATAMAPTQAIYRGAADEMNRQMTMSGRAMNPAAMSRLAREQSGQIGDVANRTEANIAQLMQQGREFGATGLSGAATNRAQIAQIGMESRLAVEALDAQMKEAGAAGMTEIEKERLAAEFQNAALNQSAARANAANANAAASRAAGASAANNADAWRQAQFIAAQRGMGLEGAANLYATTPAATALGMQGLLNEQALYTQQQLGNLPQRPAPNQPGRDWLGTAGQIAEIGGSLMV